MRQFFVMAAAVLLLFSSCREIFAKRIRGNGNITTQTRSAGQFSGIDASGSIDVYVSQGTASSVRVEADENLQQYIDAFVDGDVLRVKTQEGYNIRSSRKIKVYVSAPTLKKFEASGACDIFSESKITSTSDVDISLSGSCDVTLELSAPKIFADVSGACTVKLKGDTKDFKVEGSGSTDIKCFELVADNVNLDISGAGDAEVFANAKLVGEISGAASVHYKGNAQTDMHTSGATSVKKVE